MKPFRAVIFDMDGVIVDSEPLHERAFREVFAEIGYVETHGVDFAADEFVAVRLRGVPGEEFLAAHPLEGCIGHADILHLPGPTE